MVIVLALQIAARQDSWIPRTRCNTIIRRMTQAIIQPMTAGLVLRQEIVGAQMVEAVVIAEVAAGIDL